MFIGFAPQVAGRSCEEEGPRRVLSSSAVVSALFWNSYQCCGAIYFGMPSGWYFWPSLSQGEATAANWRSFSARLWCWPFLAVRLLLIQLPSTSSFTVLQNCLMCCCYGKKGSAGKLLFGEKHGRHCASHLCSDTACPLSAFWERQGWASRGWTSADGPTVCLP